jgi:catechol 2,3-dioxygenase-like lactoylglutathione lyase family enzyme
MPDILGLHHATVIAGDPQQNVDFYAGALGLLLVKLTLLQPLMTDGVIKKHAHVGCGSSLLSKGPVDFRLHAAVYEANFRRRLCARRRCSDSPMRASPIS